MLPIKTAVFAKWRRLETAWAHGSKRFALILGLQTSDGSQWQVALVVRRCVALVLSARNGKRTQAEGFSLNHLVWPSPEVFWKSQVALSMARMTCAVAVSPWRSTKTRTGGIC